MKNEEKGEFFLGKITFWNCAYFLKKPENGKLCKHNQERGRSSHGKIMWIEIQLCLK